MYATELQLHGCSTYNFSVQLNFRRRDLSWCNSVRMRSEGLRLRHTWKTETGGVSLMETYEFQ